MKTLATITKYAREKQLEVLLAGGHAVIIHGYQRTTFDADLVIRRDDRARWLALMQSLGFEMFHEGPAFLQFNAATNKGIPIDLMTTGNETFQQLLAAAIPNPDPSHPAVISLRHLVAMKSHAIRHGHARRIGKDMDDVIHLFKINQLDPEKAEWHELILKFGTQEFYEQLSQACRKD